MLIPPETSNTYMFLGYLVTAILLGGTVVYLFLKARAFRMELKALETQADVSTENKPAGAQNPPVKDTAHSKATT